MATEKALFDMSDKRPEKIIYMPDGKEKTKAADKLNHHYLSDLQEEAYRLRDVLKKYHLVATTPAGKKYTPEPIQLIYTGEKKLKKDFIAFLTIVKHPKNAFLFFDEWGEPTKEIFRKTLANHFIYHKEATQLLGEPSIVKKEKYFWENEVACDKLSDWFECTKARVDIRRKDAHEIKGSYLSLKDGTLYVQFMHVFFPEKFQIEKCQELPHAEEYKTYSGEANIFTVLPILSSLFDSGQLNLGRSKIPATELKKAAKLINLPEFFDDGNKYFGNLCALFVLNIYTIYCEDWYDNSLTEPQDLLKDIFETIAKIQDYLLPIAMPHFSGLRKNICESSYANPLVILLNQSLEDLQANEWIQVEKLLTHCRTWDIYAERKFLLFYLEDIDRGVLHNDFDNKTIYIDDMLREFTYPFLKAVLFVYAAFGFVEVAYKEKSAEDATSYFDSLEYVRLTNLGKYALGISKKYVRTQQKDIQYFELDEERLIIKSLVENNPYENLLGNMAAPISKKMYKASYESFLSGCEKLQDITNKIDFFKEYICAEPPANWEQFFKELKKRCKPMKAPQKKYSLFQIPADNKELQRIILTDPVIRKYSLKAEGFILLVETSNKGKVMEALKKYGYLL